MGKKEGALAICDLGAGKVSVTNKSSIVLDLGKIILKLQSSLF